MQTLQGKFMTVMGIIITVLFTSGCTKNENVVGSEQIVGSGRLVSESRAVGSFTGIQVTNFADVFITQDTVESLRIESDDNIIGLVATSMNRNTLVVGLPHGSYTNVTVHVYASMKSIKLLESIGAATFSTVHPIQTDSLTCKITGAGTFTLGGITTYENIVITGSGDIRNSNLKSSFCSVIISGAGHVDVQVTQQLDAMISGTGNITYAGNPAVIHQLVTGVGVIEPGH